MRSRAITEEYIKLGNTQDPACLTFGSKATLFPPLQREAAHQHDDAGRIRHLQCQEFIIEGRLRSIYGGEMSSSTSAEVDRNNANIRSL